MSLRRPDRSRRNAAKRALSLDFSNAASFARVDAVMND